MHQFLQVVCLNSAYYPVVSDAFNINLKHGPDGLKPSINSDISRKPSLVLSKARNVLIMATRVHDSGMADDFKNSIPSLHD